MGDLGSIGDGPRLLAMRARDSVACKAGGARSIAPCGQRCSEMGLVRETAFRGHRAMESRWASSDGEGKEEGACCAPERQPLLDF